MKRFAIALCVCAGLVAPMLADDSPAEPQPAENEAAKSLVEQLKEQPDDKALMDKYMLKNLGELRPLISTDPDAAEKQLAEMKVVIESLEPKTDAGKRLLGRAKSAIGYFGGQLELARVSVDDLVAKLKENPDDPKTISMYWSKFMADVYPLTRTDPDEAGKRFSAAKQLLTDVKEKAQQDPAKKAVEGIERSFARLEQRIESGKKLLALVGSDSAPLEVEGWVNGDPLTEGDLKGKVVLLDFWAVWCGPCIGTFPHLRDWQEKYADDGLVIVGLTRYYGYSWDDEAARPKRASGDEKATPEQEREMLTKFAEHHNLHHRFAIQKDKTLSDFYAVSGIPHVVVIDREGKVRLIRVGSGEQNAKDISEMIEKLIADG